MKTWNIYDMNSRTLLDTVTASDDVEPWDIKGPWLEHSLVGTNWLEDGPRHRGHEDLMVSEPDHYGEPK